MKKILLAIFGFLYVCNVYAFQPELKTYKLSDGEQVLGRMCFPEDGSCNTIVFAIHGTGTHNHLNMRKGAFNFNYYDDLAAEFCNRGVAFFSYDRRSVTVDEYGEAPYFSKVDTLKYQKYTPHREAEDVENLVSALRKDKRFKKSKIILYGLSEGTIISAMVAERNKVEVDALFLHGYCNENMYDIVVWQNQGHGVMIMANLVFDKDKDGKISAEEYNSDAVAAKAYRNYLFPETEFEAVDTDKDGFITAVDIESLRKGLHDGLMNAIKNDDNKWILDNYVFLTSVWFKEHFSLEANKTRLLRLDLPIHIFHGTHDPNVPVEGVHDIMERFRVMNKSNLTAHIFKNHNHDLNFELWLVKKEWPEGMLKIFDTAAEIF